MGKIDFSNKKNIKGLIVLSGRELGYSLRKEFSFDEKDCDDKTYDVIFPDSIISISTSFFLALFGESVRNCGSRDKFLNKYKIKSSNNLKNNINDGINDALNNVDGLV